MDGVNYALCVLLHVYVQLGLQVGRQRVVLVGPCRAAVREMVLVDHQHQKATNKVSCDVLGNPSDCDTKC